MQNKFGVGVISVAVWFFFLFVFFKVHLLSTSGRMPPKQIVRREPGDNSSSSSDSFDHLTRPVRDHGLASDSRMVWGSDPYPQSEPLPSVTPPKGRDDNKEQRLKNIN